MEDASRGLSCHGPYYHMDGKPVTGQLGQGHGPFTLETVLIDESHEEKIAKEACMADVTILHPRAPPTRLDIFGSDSAKISELPG